MKDFTIDDMIQTGLNGYVYDFSVDVNIIDINNVSDIHKYFVKKNVWIYS